jgi:DNA repair protein RecO (recombination protein O)
MSTENSEGFIIKSIDFEDYAQILTFFSYQYGKMSIVAPGVRKTESKNKYSVQLFTKSDFEFFKARTTDKISKLKTGIIIKQYPNISKDYTTYLYVSAVTTIIDELSVPGLPDLETYMLLETFLESQNDDNKRFMSYVFSLYFLSKLGGAKLLLDRCVRCRKAYNFYRRFDYKQNGLVCSNCFMKGENIQKVSYIEMFIDLNRLTLPELIKRNYNFIDLIAFHNVLVNYYENEMGMFVRTFKEFKGTASLIVPKQFEADYL